MVRVEPRSRRSSTEVVPPNLHGSILLWVLLLLRADRGKPEVKIKIKIN